MAGSRGQLHDLADRVERAMRTVPLVRPFGLVSMVAPSFLVIEGLSEHLRVGSLAEIGGGSSMHLAEVVHLEKDRATAMLFDAMAPVALGARAYPAPAKLLFPHESWRGRILDGLGRPADGGTELRLGDNASPLLRPPPGAMLRQAIGEVAFTGVRAVDVFTPLCFGQRIGIFAGSGVGKSTLLSMLARASGFDLIVAALVGERGREVREFVQEVLGGLMAKAIAVVSTSDESAMMRRLAPATATAIAEHFRTRGARVLLLVDSVTRYALACRDVALAAGEPPVARGFPPSVFSELPRLLERAGMGHEGEGSITGVYSVLVDGDDHNDPVADAIRGTLDGHIVLDRTIAETGRFPAIDLLASVSRLADKAWSAEQRRQVMDLRQLVGRFEDSRDLRAMGGIVPGADPELDRAAATVPALYRCLTQSLGEPPSSDGFKEVAAALSAPR